MTVDTFADDDGGGQDDQAAAEEPEESRYHSVYDGIAGFGPGDEGRSQVAKGPHPPIYCPNPRIIPSPRGLYRCPCCGVKIRHSSHVPVRERAYENTEYFWGTVAEALVQLWDIARPFPGTLASWAARAIAWMARAARNLITRNRQESQENAASTGPVPAGNHNRNENAQIECTTSDGIHVINVTGGHVECIVCGVKMAGRETG